MNTKISIETFLNLIKDALVISKKLTEIKAEDIFNPMVNKKTTEKTINFHEFDEIIRIIAVSKEIIVRE